MRMPTPLRLGSGLINPEEEDAGEGNSGLEDVSAAVVSCVDTPPVFEASEEVFDPVPLPVEGGVVGKASLVVAVRGDACGDAASIEGLSEPVTVIGSIGEQDGCLGQVGGQGPGADMVVALPFGEKEAQGATPAIAQHVQLAGQAAPAASDSAG